jgi:predicted metal-dependent HD superfamily phosphohydrolase
MHGAETLVRSAWWQLAGRQHDRVLEDVFARHREPHRRYHTLIHVAWVLRHIDEILDSMPADSEAEFDRDAIRAAAIFHDVIYNATSSTNEVDSALLANDAMLSVGWSPARCVHVADLIRDTATHVARSPDAGVLLDADLAVLGADPAGYQAYVNGVRNEYSYVDVVAWRRGRSRVLDEFLQRPQIFVTEAGRRLFERPARANIAAEMATLTNDGNRANDA